MRRWFIVLAAALAIVLGDGGPIRAAAYNFDAGGKHGELVTPGSVPPTQNRAVDVVSKVVSPDATPEVGLRRTSSNHAPGSTRLAQDIAVNPTAPRALPLTRPVGASTTQNQVVQSRIASLQADGATAIRVNQQQVNIDGVRVGISRPDLQYTLNGQRFYEEFDTALSNRGPLHALRIGAIDPSGVIKLSTVD